MSNTCRKIRIWSLISLLVLTNVFIVLDDPELIWDVEIEEQKNLKPSGQDVRFRIAWASPSVMMMLIIGIWRYVCSIPWLSLSDPQSGCTTP